MIDHLTVQVRDVEAAAAFYAAALAPLGMTEVARDRDAIGFGADAWRFGVASGTPASPKHIAFAAGGACNGAPGDRPAYGASYFACYVHDPDGNNIEAVFRGV